MIQIFHGVPKGGSSQPAVGVDMNTGKLYYSGGNVTGWTEVTASADAGGVPASPTGSVQFNNSGAFGGSSVLTFDSSIGPVGQVRVGGATDPDGILTGALQVNFTPVASAGPLQGFGVTAVNHADLNGADFENPIYTVTYNAGGNILGLMGHSYFDMENYGGGHISTMRGPYLFQNNQDASDIDEIQGYVVSVVNDAGAIVNNDVKLYGGYVQNAGTLPTAIIYWGGDLSGQLITNPYYEWFDSQGVYRIKEDASHNAVGQAVPAHYNPRFTKYTPGLANFERITQYWDTDIAHFGVEKGGSGTLRDLKMIANRIYQSTPASAPSDGNLSSSSVSFYLDESGNNLKVRVKYSDGTTLKTATIALA